MEIINEWHKNPEGFFFRQIINGNKTCLYQNVSDKKVHSSKISKGGNGPFKAKVDWSGGRVIQKEGIFYLTFKDEEC